MIWRVGFIKFPLLPDFSYFNIVQPTPGHTCLWHDTVSHLQAMFVLIEDLETNHGLVFYVMPGNKSYSD